MNADGQQAVLRRLNAAYGEPLTKRSPARGQGGEYSNLQDYALYTARRRLP